MSAHSARARAFTIVEILVVIGVLALLLGMLLPALSGAQKRSRKHDELNSIRQVGLGWILYSNGNNDKILPGFLEVEVQKKWRVAYEYPNHKDILPAPSYSLSGPNLAGPWTWRLMPYLEYNHDIVHGYAEEEEFDAVTLGDGSAAAEEEAAEIAYFPGFGYNAHYVGGWWDMDSGLDRTRLFDAKIDGKRVNVLSRSIGTIRRSTQLITFCSSALLKPGTYRKFEFTHPGWHSVIPPWLGQEQQWGWEGALEVYAQNPAPMGRYNGLAATLYADGHTAANQVDELTDIRHWIDTAESREFRHD